jgi:hypothetical protein
MDRNKIQQEQVIERYLAGKLSPEDEQALEEAYLADPALFEEIKLAERLREGFRDLPESAHAPSPAPRPRWLELAGSPRYGIAATIVAAAALVAAGALYLQDQGLGTGAVATVAHDAGRTRVLQLVSVRGEGNPNTIAAPAAGEWTVLLLDAGFGDYDRYRAALAHAGGDEILRVDDMTPSYEGMIALGLPGRLLPPGRYEIRLEGGRRDWPSTQALEELSRTPLTVTP